MTMGFPCLRVHGQFFACVDRRTGDLVVKVPPARVGELVADGIGVPFAPNGKVFRAWVAIPIRDEEECSALLDEGRAFVQS